MNTFDKIAVASRSFSKNERLIAELKSRYSDIILNDSGETLEGENLINFLSPADKAIIGIESLTSTNLSQLPNLKVISKYGVGLNNIDLEFCKSKSIKLGFIPGVNKQSVAEHALTLILMSLRQIHMNHSEIIDGHWSQTKGHELHGKDISILGFGNIGQTLGALLKPFNCNISFVDERIFSKEELSAINRDSLMPIKQVSLESAMLTGDIISIHLPLNESTHQSINKYSFQQLKSTAILINTARGGIVNEHDLHSFLLSEKNAFAAFDVFEEEPSFNNPLFSLKNFFGTSHRASLTVEGIHSMGMAAINGLDENLEIQ